MKNIFSLARFERRREKCLMREKKSQARRNRVLTFFASGLAFVLAAAGFATSGVGAVLAVVLGFASASSVAYAVGGPVAFGLVPRYGNYIPGIAGIGSGQIATVNAPVDRRYHSLRILTTNAAGALTDATTIVSLVELVVNGIVMRSGTPAHFINIAKTYRYTPNTGEIPIFFTEFWRNETPFAAEATSWDLVGERSFTIRLTFLSPGGGVGIQSILADFDGKRNVRRGEDGKPVFFKAIIKQQTQTINFSGAGTQDITTLPTNWPIQRIFMAVDANAISTVQLFGDNNVKIWEATKTENQIYLGPNDITPTFFEYPIIFDYDNRLDSGLSTATLQARVTVTGGALALTCVVHQMVDGFR